MDAASGVAFWVLRSRFEGREAAIETLRTSGELLHDVLRLADGTFGFLVREPAANRLRDEWAAEASTKALEWAGAHHWDRAREAATRAFVLERAMSPERIAMLALAHARCGNETRAHGYVEMAKRSRGSDFAAQVAEKRTDSGGASCARRPLRRGAPAVVATSTRATSRRCARARAPEESWMKGPRLTELPIKHLEYVFSPPGLMLPVKGESEHGTTSILVRGGAGTGKTTFALALAHALAKAARGWSFT